ncbi:MAG: class I SAM-dependent methyltransferase [Candidatus Eisenbacteria bacterium]|uniref:Class I SAM-dependent methyltransferase n=1 Tax=Eiseniibacteriota bacterium TaxID=2212470 RepID=A0A849SP75_UNCEI|nr:class I SAM-dependent methyltransferase [Candidatus Eisenbacteria bacterium]
MNRKIDLFDSTYSHFEAEMLARIRHKTFGEDFGQNSWTTADEYRRWARWLSLDERSHVLEVASGSGGPALFLAGLCGARVTGIDINAHGVATATQRAESEGAGDRVTFREVDAGAKLPFADATFDALLCIDSANHLAERFAVLQDWLRVLKPGGKALFSDPVVVTGLVSNEELAARSSIGFFVFTPPGVNERMIREAGFELAGQEDVTENAAGVSRRWHDARAEDRAALLQIEGDERFEGLQKFFATVHALTSQRRLSRFVYLARRPI